MILLLGASGYIGRTFAGELRRRGRSFIPLTRGAFDYTRFDFLFDYLRTMRPQFVINAASYSGVGQTQLERETLMAANAILPQMVARACLMTKTPWGHISSGSIYSGAKFLAEGKQVVQRDLTRPETVSLFEREPERFRGFTELDEPNFTFRNFPCNFYSGTKALAEETIRDIGHSYLWRLRLPFNDREDPCNWLAQMRLSSRLGNAINSFSQVEDCVRACLDLWEARAPFGIYNVTNPGALSTRQIVQSMERILRVTPRPAKPLQFPRGQTAEPSCILDASKAIRAGAKLRPITEALDESLEILRVSLRNSEQAKSGQATIPLATL